MHQFSSFEHNFLPSLSLSLYPIFFPLSLLFPYPSLPPPPSPLSPLLSLSLLSPLPSLSRIFTCTNQNISRLADCNPTISFIHTTNFSQLDRDKLAVRLFLSGPLWLISCISTTVESLVRLGREHLLCGVVSCGRMNLVLQLILLKVILYSRFVGVAVQTSSPRPGAWCLHNYAVGSAQCSGCGNMLVTFHHYRRKYWRTYQFISVSMVWKEGWMALYKSSPAQRYVYTYNCTYTSVSQ